MDSAGDFSKLKFGDKVCARAFLCVSHRLCVQYRWVYEVLDELLSPSFAVELSIDSVWHRVSGAATDKGDKTKGKQKQKDKPKQKPKQTEKGSHADDGVSASDRVCASENESESEAVSLSFPLPLSNMRYFVRLYQKL